MSVKIINVLKDDSFNDILDLFRQATAAEVILVLPRVGKLFRHEDHFAAFASEAQQGGKTVSVLTSNPQTAQLARKFGFGVMASGTSRTAKATTAPVALASAAVPVDFSTRDFDDTADLGDVPLTSDQTIGNEPDDEEEVDPLRGMHIEDEDGPVDADNDGQVDTPDDESLTIADDAASFVSALIATPHATLAAAPKPIPARPPQPNDIDGVRISPPKVSVPTTARTEKPQPIPVAKASPVTDEEAARADLDYIDAVWRNKNGNVTPEAIVPPMQSAVLRRTIPGVSRFNLGGFAPKRAALAILVGAVIVLGAVVYLITGSAHVAITPVSKTVDTQITVQSSDTFTSVDDAFAKIPGQLIEVSKSADNTVQSTGKREVASKARGKLTVFNEYSSSPQTLIATTRFQSEGGKIFRTLQNITVPGSSVQSGKTVAGKVTVDVIADAPGTDFNVPAGRFIIASFKEKGDAEKVQKFYGTSDAPMSGGASGPSTVVTQADFDAAKLAATESVQKQIAAALESQGANLVVLDADKPSMATIKSTANVDDAAPSTTVTATGTIKTIAFRKQDLMDLIRNTILKKDHLTVLPDQLELSYTDLSFKPDLGTLVFTVTLKGSGYVPVDTDAIASEIRGKNAQSIRDYFRNKEGVQSATVTLSPFWVTKVPQNKDKINIELVVGSAAQ